MKLHIQFLLPADTFTPAACLPQPPGNGAIQSVRGSCCAPRPQQHTQYIYIHSCTNERTSGHLPLSWWRWWWGGPSKLPPCDCEQLVPLDAGGRRAKKKKKSRVIGGGREEKRRLVTAPADPEWLTGGLSGWGCVNYSSPRHLSPAKTDPTRRPDISETTVSGVGGFEGGGTRALKPPLSC